MDATEEGGFKFCLKVNRSLSTKLPSDMSAVRVLFLVLAVVGTVCAYELRDEGSVVQPLESLPDNEPRALVEVEELGAGVSPQALKSSIANMCKTKELKAKATKKCKNSKNLGAAKACVKKGLVPEQLSHEQPLK